MNLYRYLNLSLLAFTGVLLLISLFIVNMMPIDTLLVDKIIWVEWSTLFFAIAVFLTEISSQKKGFVFCLADFLLLGYTALEFVFYDSTSNFNQFNIVFSGQLLMIWFLSRTAMQYYPELKLFFVFVIICVSIIIVILILFLNINTQSLHYDSPIAFYRNRHFQLSQMLYIFIAVLIPLCVNGIIRFFKTSKKNITEIPTFFLYFYSGALLFFLYILIKGGNHEAWVSAGVGSLWVIGFRLKQKQLPPKISKVSKIIYAVAVVALCAFAYQSAKSYAQTKEGRERILVWKVTKNLLKEDNPLIGHGYGTFSMRYAYEQGLYLKSDKANKDDIIYASAPLNSGSGYLQSIYEIGFFGCAIFILWIIVSAIDGTKNRTLGLSGLIISTATLFIFISPQQYPILWTIMFIAASIAVSDTNQQYKGRNYKVPYIGLIMSLAVFLSFYFEYEYVEKYKQWFQARQLIENKNYKMAARRFVELYPDLNYEPLFLKDGINALQKANHINEPNIWFRRARRLSFNPQLFYDASEYRISNKEFGMAEQVLRQTKRALPAMPETYIRLMRLYSMPQYRNVIRFKITYKQLKALNSIPGFKIPDDLEKEAEIMNKNIVIPESFRENKQEF